MEIENTVIVSDIHMGSEVSRSGLLKKTLSPINFDKFIINGDGFDHLDFRDLSHDDWKLINYFRQLIHMDVEIIWIRGNHDWALTSKRMKKLGLEKAKLCKEYVWFKGWEKCIAIHGHQFDKFLFRHPVLSDIAAFIYALVQKVDTKNQKISRFIKRHSKGWLREAEEVKEGAIRYAIRKKCEYVFCGHTHLPDHAICGGEEYYNDGCWTYIPSSYILINGEDVSMKDVY